MHCAASGPPKRPAVPSEDGWSEPSTITDGRPGRKNASQQGKCSPAVRPAPERRTDQRFGWSVLVWSPLPESNRRPHPSMEPPGTAVRNAIFAGHARPSGPKLSVLLRRSYAFFTLGTTRRCPATTLPPEIHHSLHPIRRPAGGELLIVRLHHLPSAPRGIPGHRGSRPRWPEQYPVLWSVENSRSIRSPVGPHRSPSRTTLLI
jgi:hypothetical protein